MPWLPDFAIPVLRYLLLIDPCEFVNVKDGSIGAGAKISPGCFLDTTEASSETARHKIFQ